MTHETEARVQTAARHAARHKAGLADAIGTQRAKISLRRARARADLLLCRLGDRLARWIDVTFPPSASTELLPIPVEQKTARRRPGRSPH